MSDSPRSSILLHDQTPTKGIRPGLAVCKSIVAMHGGTIGIANKEEVAAREPYVGAECQA
jgi:nitrogen fixation/metabolism regulation signal transduction histidine kinase